MKEDFISHNELISLNERNLARVINWVSVIDSKAKFIFSVILVVLGYSITRLGPLTKSSATLWENKVFGAVALMWFFIIGSFVCIIISFIHLMFIIYPKRKPYTGKSSHFYYESIAEMPISEFQAKMSSITITEAILGLSDQTYNVAKVVKSKFDQLSTSIIWFLISIGFLIIMLIMHEVITKLYLIS